MTSRTMIVDLHVLHIEFGSDSGFVMCQGARRNCGIGFRGHRSMTSSTVIVDLHVLNIEFGGNSRFVNASRSPLELSEHSSL